MKSNLVLLLTALVATTRQTVVVNGLVNRGTVSSNHDGSLRSLKSNTQSHSSTKSKLKSKSSSKSEESESSHGASKNAKTNKSGSKRSKSESKDLDKIHVPIRSGGQQDMAISDDPVVTTHATKGAKSEEESVTDERTERDEEPVTETQTNPTRHIITEAQTEPTQAADSADSIDDEVIVETSRDDDDSDDNNSTCCICDCDCGCKPSDDNGGGDGGDGGDGGGDTEEPIDVLVRFTFDISSVRYPSGNIPGGTVLINAVGEDLFSSGLPANQTDLQVNVAGACTIIESEESSTSNSSDALSICSWSVGMNDDPTDFFSRVSLTGLINHESFKGSLPVAGVGGSIEATAGELVVISLEGASNGRAQALLTLR